MLGLPRLPPRQARARHRARPRRRDHANADGQRVPDPGPAGQVLRRRHGSARGGRARHRRAPRHLRARLHAQVLRGHGLPRAHQLHGELQRPGHALRDRRAQGMGGAQLLLQHRLRREQRPRLRRALVAPRRLRAAAGDDRSRVRLVGVPGRHRPGERLGAHRRPRARLLPREPLLDGDRPPRHPGGRARADPGDDVPSAHERADRELRGVPRLLAAPLLQQRGRHRRVLGLPREGRRDGPLPAAQVGGPRTRRRGAHPARDHPRRAPPGRRPRRLHGGLQRDRRHDRRRHRLPAGRRQLPLHRRRPVRRRLAEGPRRAPRPARRTSSPRPTSCTTSPSRAPRAARS